MQYRIFVRKPTKIPPAMLDLWIADSYHESRIVTFWYSPSKKGYHVFEGFKLSDLVLMRLKETV